MPLIEGFRVQNYRSLRDVSLGRLTGSPDSGALTPLTVVIGKNGAGKSTLFDAFGFIADCLTTGVEAACDREQRGGFERLRSRGIQEPVRFEIYYREAQNQRPITYELATHQPYFVDALDPEEVWILEKGSDGFSAIRRVSELEVVRNLVTEGLPLGGLWYSDYLDSI